MCCLNLIHYKNKKFIVHGEASISPPSWGWLPATFAQLGNGFGPARSKGASPYQFTSAPVRKCLTSCPCSDVLLTNIGGLSGIISLFGLLLLAMSGRVDCCAAKDTFVHTGRPPSISYGKLADLPISIHHYVAQCWWLTCGTAHQSPMEAAFYWTWMSCQNSLVWATFQPYIITDNISPLNACRPLHQIPFSG